MDYIMSWRALSSPPPYKLGLFELFSRSTKIDEALDHLLALSFKHINLNTSLSRFFSLFHVRLDSTKSSAAM